MNKLFTKIAALALGATMATGVGVAVASGASDAKQVSAASAWQAHTGAITAGNEYLIVSVSGTYCMVPANTSSTGTTTKAAGGYSATSFTAASGPDMGFVFADAGSSHFYIKDGACFVRANGTTNNGLASATSNSTNPSYGTWIVTETSTSGEYTLINTNGTGRQISLYGTTNWRSYGTTSGSKTNVKLYEKAKTAQTITASADSVYSDESVTLTTNATSATWSITSGGSYAHLSSTSGKSVSLIGDAAGSVTVKAVASGYTDATKTITFNERPAGTFYDVTFDSNGGSSSPAKQSIQENETFTFPSPGTKTHYTFAGWSSDGGTTKYATGATSPAVIADIEYTAYWTEDAKVTVTYAAGTNASGSYTHSNQYVGSYSLLALSSLSGITYDSSTYRLKDYVVGGVSKQPGDSITLSTATTVTVNFEEIPLEYQVIFGTAEGTSGITDFSNTSYVIPSGVTLNNIQGNVYSNTSNQAASLRFGKSGTTGSFDATISGNYYIVSVKCNLKYYGSDSTATFAVTPDGGSAISKSLTGSWADYTYDVSAAQAKKVTLGTDVNGKRAYLSGFTITYAAQKTLSNIALSGTYPTSFTKGDTFSHAGMVVTANYSDSTSATVTTSATWSSPDMTTTGNKTVTVSYSDEYGSASKTYSITVNYAAVTSVSLSENTAEIGLGEVFDYNLVTVTVNPSNANPAVTWSVDSNTVGDDYVFDASGLLAGDTEGTITLKCESDADSSKYATLVVTVTGDPTAAFVKESTSGYAGKSEEIAFTYGNIDDESKIAVASSNPSIVSVANDLVADEGEGLVTINFVAAGSANVTISYNGGETLDTLPVTVSADSVVSVTWNASNFDVFSGTTLTSDIDNTWLASYEMASGDEDLISYGDYTLKLGGTAITLPHTWVAADSGKNLCIEYGGVSSSTVSVTVTQTINAVYADTFSSHTSDLTFTEACGGSGTADDSKEWTVTSDGTESTFDTQNGKGIHYGTGSAAVQYIKLTSSDFTSGKIKKVEVNASTASGVSATVSVTVGGDAFGGDPQALTSSAVPDNPYTFTGDVDADTIEVLITKPESATKALYCKSVVVTYETSSGSVNIANNPSHKAAQRAAVAFANAFNAAMDTTSNCTTNMSSAWATCSSAYDSFKSAAAALGSTEEAWAKNLVKYATAQYSDDSGEACIERMMKTYEICVSKHGQTAFMSDLVSVGRAPVTPLVVVGENTNTVSIIVIISLVSISAIGGYIFLRKRKEN